MSDYEVETTEVVMGAEVEAKGPVVISATNPDAEEMAGIIGVITANYNFDVDVKANDFSFKKSTDKDTGIESIRETVQVAVPYPSVQGVCNILEVGGKQLELLMEAVYTITNAAVRAELADDYSLNAANFPVDKVSWEAIANQPKATRRGGGIPKEVWDGFEVDYIEVMPEITGKTVDQITNAAKILKGKLTQVRTNEPVLKLLVEQLAVYAEATTNLDDYAECVEFLLGKADTFLNVTDEQLLAAL
tara:strand:- start:570 stop:1310 length:741 start_codon:yes stop_codon:yes gene_type:complete